MYTKGEGAESLFQREGLLLNPSVSPFSKGREDGRRKRRARVDLIIIYLYFF